MAETLEKTGISVTIYPSTNPNEISLSWAVEPDFCQSEPFGEKYRTVTVPRKIFGYNPRLKGVRSLQ